MHQNIQVNSGYRSVAEQTVLWNKSDKTGHMVAAPGHSKHQTGYAADIGPSSMQEFTSAGRQVGKYGLYWPMTWEDWHIQDTNVGSGGTAGGGGTGGVNTHDIYKQAVKDWAALGKTVNGQIANIPKFDGQIPGKAVGYEMGPKTWQWIKKAADAADVAAAAASAMSGGANLGPGHGGAEGTVAGNAKIIAQTGKSMGFNHKGIVIALMAAMQESGLLNLHYGDRDSQGLFQMRPSMGWGSVAQVTDPVYASKKFFSVLNQQPWERMSNTAAAQAVEKSGFPGAYAKWEGKANAMASGMGYRQGTNYVPQDGPAFLHRGEAVIPRNLNPAASGGSTTMAPHIQVFIGERELTDIVDVRVDGHSMSLANSIANGRNS
jgi:hypothetical protein